MTFNTFDAMCIFLIFLSVFSVAFFALDDYVKSKKKAKQTDQ